MTTPRDGSTTAYEAARAWHLATSEDDELATTFEFALMQVYEAYQRWVVQAQRLVSRSELNYNETVVLHVVRMQERAKDAATIATLVNRDDLPNVLYNLRKLVSLGLIAKVRVGSGTYFEITDQGREETDRYAELRRDLLISNVQEIAQVYDKLKIATDLMHSMTGVYGTAARETAAMNPAVLFPERPAKEPDAEPASASKSKQPAAGGAKKRTAKAARPSKSS